MVYDKKIIVIDDEPEILEELDLLLKEKSDKYQIDLVSTSTEGFELIQKNKYDLLITDLNLPDYSGKELLVKVNELDEKDQPKRTLVISGLFELGREVVFSKVTTLPKPWDEDVFFKYLDYALPDGKEEEEIQSLSIPDQPVKGLSPDQFYSLCDEFLMHFFKEQLTTPIEKVGEVNKNSKNKKLDISISFEYEKFKGLINMIVDHSLIESFESRFGTTGEFKTAEGRNTGIQKLSKIVFSEFEVKLSSLKHDIKFSESSSRDYLSYKDRSLLRYLSAKGNVTFQIFIKEMKS